jgi:hypothetical protein
MWLNESSGLNSSPEMAGIVGCLRCLPLLRGFDDEIHQNAGHIDIMGFQGIIPDDPFHLGNNDAAIVMGGHGEIERADVSALVLEGEIAALVR